MELTEHDEQALLIKWFDLKFGNKYVLFAIPNGGLRNALVAKKLKKEGVRAGVPDLFLAAPANGFSGLFIEMKRAKGGKLTLFQKEMISNLQTAGYRCELCHGFEQAKLVIEDYLNFYDRKNKEYLFMHFDKNGEEILDNERLFLNNLIQIIERLYYAKKKHKKEEWQKMTLRDAFNALREEVEEVELEVNKNNLKRVNDELLDVIAVAIRMLCEEYKK